MTIRKLSRQSFIVVMGAALLITWLVGYNTGVWATKSGWGEKLERSQVELRLDMKELKKEISQLQLKEELMKIVQAIFQERDEIIDWNRSHIILTVEPDSEEGN